MNYMSANFGEKSEILKHHSHILRLTRIKKIMKIKIQSEFIKLKFKHALIRLRGYLLWLSILKDLRVYGTSSHLFDSFDRYRRDLFMIFKPRVHKLTFLSDTEPDFKNLVNPNSLFFQIWNLLLLFFLLYAFIVMPWVMAFEEIIMFNFWFCIEITVDLFCFCDIIVTLNTPYYDLLGKIVVSKRKIFFNYLKGSLIFDLISIFPFYLLESHYVFKSNSLVRIIRITSISKVVRGSKIVKLLKYLKNSENIAQIIHFLKLYRGVVRLILLIICILIMAHFIACMFYYTARMDEFSESTWVARYNLQDLPKETKYLHSLYFIITTLTTVGFGDIVPYTAPEILLCVAWMILGICFYSTIVSTISSVFSSIDSRRVLISEQLNEIEKLGKYFNVGKKCIKQIKLKISKNTIMNKRINEYEKKKIFNEMPKKIQIMIINTIYKEAIKKIEFFKHRDFNFLIEVLPSLKYVEIKPNTIVYNRHEQADFIYFVLKGRVCYIVGDGNFQFKSIVSGTYFGEIEILMDLQRKYTVVSEEHCELLLMNANMLINLMEKYRNISEEIWVLAQKRNLINQECYKQVVEVLDAVNIKKEATLGQLAGKKKCKKFNEFEKLLVFNKSDAEEKIFNEIEYIGNTLDKVTLNLINNAKYN